jgi:hypothetical protein
MEGDQTAQSCFAGLLQNRVGAEKVPSHPKTGEKPGYEMSRNLRTSLITHSDAILFAPILARKSFSTATRDITQ